MQLASRTTGAESGRSRTDFFKAITLESAVVAAFSDFESIKFLLYTLHTFLEVLLDLPKHRRVSREVFGTVRHF